MVKHCCAQKCTVEIETYRAYDTVLIQHGRSEREIFSHCFHIYIWKLTLCFPQGRFRKLEGGRVIQCWNLNRIVLFRQHRILQIRFTDKCDAGIKGKNETPRKLVRNSLARRTITNPRRKENIWCAYLYYNFSNLVGTL